MKHIKHISKPILFLSLILTCVTGACDDYEASLMDAAWKKFENQDYDGAYAEFSALNGPNARIGLGWTLLRMDSIPEADRAFRIAAADSVLDGYAGIAITSWKTGRYTSAIYAANFVERWDPEYYFVHDPSVELNDLILHKAFCQYYLNDLTACNASIKKLDPAWVTSTNPATVLNKLEALYDQMD